MMQPSRGPRVRMHTNKTALLFLGVVALGPIAVTAACGGKVAGTDDVDKPSVAVGVAPSAPGATAASTSALPPCGADSTPSPLPDPPDPQVLAQCQTFCDRNFTCAGCTYGTCLPNCMWDAIPTRPSGAPYVAWMTCLLAHDPVCGVQPACDAEYCAYT